MYYELQTLREYFRKRMKERDFCIGEEEVEKVFRELLGEPEPEVPESTGEPLSAAEISTIIERHFGGMDKVKDLFERDNAFYKMLSKKGKI